MTRFRQALFLFAIAACTIAWRPNGWVYHTPPYQYALNEATWRYIDPASAMWCYEYASGQWNQYATLPQSWVFFDWPHAYVLETGTWRWMNGNDFLPCFSFAMGTWSMFGIPDSMAMIPGGTFLMGDMFDEGEPDELPVHRVMVDTFSMDKQLVSNAKLIEVLQWAQDRGKLISTSENIMNAEGDRQVLIDQDDWWCRITWDGTQFGLVSATDSNHPCVQVSWYGAVAFCNYRSEMEGLTPCYDLNNWTCNWLAGGYRLPTEAEWEKAARGGAIGHRFPWTDTETISHARANYSASFDNHYDESYPSGSHPDYPRTSPVGAFPANGYSLHDMAGNLMEWCWDRYGGYYYSDPDATTPNPHGPETGDQRVLRGGSFGARAERCRVAYRNKRWPIWTYDGHYGFRCVRGSHAP